MDLPADELDEAAFCAEFQQLGQIVEELHGFSFTNTTVPLLGEQPYTCITYVEFDQKENLIWIANDQGHTTSFCRSSLNVYSKFWWSLDKNDLIPNEIVTTDAYVIFIGKTQLAIFTRGGAPVMRYRPETIKTINCAHWSPTAPCFLYFGGEQHSIGIFNLETGKEIKGIETEDDCCLIRSTDRFLVSASKKGQISVRHKDFIQYKLTAKTIAHNAGIEDFDVFGNYLVCCGKSTRQHGVAQGDVFMKVYDIRNLGAQSPIGFNRPPIQVKFVPGLDGCICVSTGLCLFMVDILNNKTSMFVSFTLPSDGISISNSGQAIAAFINNYTPYLQIFCTSIDPPFSIFNIDPMFPIPNEELFVQFDDKTSLAVFPVAYLPHYCSDRWSGSISQPRYLYTQKQIKGQPNGKDVRYFKSPHFNTIVGGFNVWNFDEKDPVMPKVGQTTVTSNELQDNKKLAPDNASREQTPDVHVQKIKCASPSNAALLSRFENAPEFVPGRQHHTLANSPNPKPTQQEPKVEQRPEPKMEQRPEPNVEQKPEPKMEQRPEPNVEQKPEPKSGRLQNMTFDEFRSLAAKEKSSERQSK